MDFFNSFFQNVKDKLTSPFFGTLCFIMLIHHWEFWYILFNFSSKTDLNTKISILKTIGSREFYWRNITEDVLWTLLIVLVGYVIVVGTRTLSLFIEHGIMPRITRRVINKNVVLRSQYEEVREERDNYAEKYESERKYNRELSKSYDEQLKEIKNKNQTVTENNNLITDLNEKINNLNSTLSRENLKNEKLTKELAIAKSEIINLQNKLDVLEEFYQIASKIFFDEENTEFWKNSRIPLPSLLKTANDIKLAGLWKGFKEVVKFEQKGGSIAPEIYRKLEPFGIIRKDQKERLNLLGLLMNYTIENYEATI